MHASRRGSVSPHLTYPIMNGPGQRKNHTKPPRVPPMVFLWGVPGTASQQTCCCRRINRNFIGMVCSRLSALCTLSRTLPASSSVLVPCPLVANRDGREPCPTSCIFHARGRSYPLSARVKTDETGRRHKSSPVLSLLSTAVKLNRLAPWCAGTCVCIYIYIICSATPGCIGQRKSMRSAVCVRFKNGRVESATCDRARSQSACYLCVAWVSS